MRQFASQKVFFEPGREFGFGSAPGVDPNQLLLLAIERALAPPIVHMRSTFQPMRVIVVHPDSIPVNDAADGFESHTLLPLAHATETHHYADSEFHQRVVQGEILSDENGVLYEKLGRRIRQIHQLASGPSGELIELVPSRLRLLGASAGPKIVRHQEVTGASAGPEQPGDASSASQPAFIPLTSSSVKTATPTHRKLFADPGQWRVVWWGEFKEILAAQLAHPERLRDSYRLPCYVQVFETERAVTIEELAAAYALDNERQTPLYFLTNDIAAKLDLVSLLPPVPAQVSKEPRAPRTLLPHDCVFRLLAANDPTVDVASLKRKTEKPASKTAEEKVETAHNPILKQEIPRQFMKEWEFKIGREEALYDMNAKPSLGTLVLRLFRRLRIIKLRNEFRKWQALLAGKDADEQLWGVRPPEEMLADAFVSEWVTKTLTLGGYNSQKMTSEWEIFWRRKQM